MNEEETLPPVAARTPMQKLYDAAVQPLADAQPKAARKQIRKAFEAAPQTPDEVDAWFLKHFHQPPVSHDTALFNQLQAIKAAVRDAAGLQS